MDILLGIGCIIGGLFGLMMSLLRSIPQGSQHVKSRRWDYTQFVGRQVKDLKIGIIGYGRLGKMMYNFCKAFEADVMVFDPYVGNIGCSSIEDMLSKCDVISLHVHVTEETKYMINERLLGFMKKNSYIINTSRGEIVDEQAIINALKSGHLSGYGTDVIEHEFDKVFMISALKKHGLKDLVSWLANQMPHGPHLFDSNEISDSPIRLMISEILREKLIINTHQEIPYNLLVSTDSWKENSDKSITIHQIIYVEKESHKKIIIGKSGKTIKNIGIVARKEMQTFLNTKVNLFFRVKVKHICLNDPILFKSLGLDIND